MNSYFCGAVETVDTGSIIQLALVRPLLAPWRRGGQYVGCLLEAKTHHASPGRGSSRAGGVSTDAPQTITGMPTSAAATMSRVFVDERAVIYGISYQLPVTPYPDRGGPRLRVPPHPHNPREDGTRSHDIRRNPGEGGCSTVTSGQKCNTGPNIII